MKKLFSLLILCLLFCVPARACDSSSCSLFNHALHPDGEMNGRFFADFSVEQVDWNEMNAREAHLLHHEGHHFHDKTHEEFYRLSAGVSPIEPLTLIAELPYVVRGSIEIESHARLGRQESSEGWGDLRLNGIWRFVQQESTVLGWLGGVKLPTGETDVLNSGGLRFEPELQPGTGSTDGTFGLMAQTSLGGTELHGNLRYTWKGKGDQDFQFGNVFEAHLGADRLLNPNAAFPVTLGLEAEWSSEARQHENGERVEDSGGDMLLVGPSLEIEHGNVSLFGSVKLPVYQNMGGVHQELDFVWNAGAKIQW